MTENYLPGSAQPPGGEWPEPEQGTAQLVKDQASGLANSSVQAGKHVSDVATPVKLLFAQLRGAWHVQRCPGLSARVHRIGYRDRLPASAHN